MPSAAASRSDHALKWQHDLLLVSAAFVAGVIAPHLLLDPFSQSIAPASHLAAHLTLGVFFVSPILAFLFLARRRACLAQAQHAAEHQRLATVARCTDNAVILLDAQRRVTWVNDAFTRLSGYTPADVVGRVRTDLLCSPSADPAERTALTIALQQGICYRGEVLCATQSGREYWLDLDLQPQFDPQGRLTGFLSVQRDITEQIHLRRQLEHDLEQRIAAERSLREAHSYLDVYRLIVDSHAIVAETDAQGRITAVNDAFCRISGYSRPELLGQTHRLINSGVHPKSMWSDMYRTVHQSGTWHGEVCNRAKDGSLYWVETTIAALYDDHGQIRGYFAIRADITALKAAQAQAEAASRSKSEFLANMSHEIRTPMTAILGYADLLTEDADDPARARRREYIDTIKRNGEHLLAIINDILDLSKIEAGKLSVERIPVRPDQIIHDVLSLMSVKAAAKSLPLTFLCDSSIPATILTDPVRLRQILVNLVGNAIKFTETGSVTVRVSLDAPAHLLQISIVDTGIGLDPAHQARLFGAFEQADSSTTRRFGGTGLGLRISLRLAHMLGGEITVLSTPGAGSTFVLTTDTGPLDHIPLIPADSAPAILRLPAVPSRAPADRLRGIRILLAEDGLDNQRLISFHLRKAGADVRVVNDGQELVEALTLDPSPDSPLWLPAPVDLVLTDMQMPRLDGYAATRLLRRKGSQLPIIALTAHAMAGDAERCLGAGCDAYITKPVNVPRLISACLTAVTRATGVASAAGTATYLPNPAPPTDTRAQPGFSSAPLPRAA